MHYGRQVILFFKIAHHWSHSADCNLQHTIFSPHYWWLFKQGHCSFRTLHTGIWLCLPKECCWTFALMNLPAVCVVNAASSLSYFLLQSSSIPHEIVQYACGPCQRCRHCTSKWWMSCVALGLRLCLLWVHLLTLRCMRPSWGSPVRRWAFTGFSTGVYLQSEHSEACEEYAWILWSLHSRSCYLTTRPEGHASTCMLVIIDRPLQWGHEVNCLENAQVE